MQRVRSHALLWSGVLNATAGSHYFVFPRSADFDNTSELYALQIRQTGLLFTAVSAFEIWAAFSPNPEVRRFVASVLASDLCYLGTLVWARLRNGFRPAPGTINEYIYGLAGGAMVALEIALMAYEIKRTFATAK